MVNKGKARLKSLRESVKMTIGSSFDAGYSSWGFISELLIIYIVLLKGYSGFCGTVWHRSV